LTNCTIACNVAFAGSGGLGGSGAIYTAAGSQGPYGYASGGTPSGYLLNVLVASNTPAGGDTFPVAGLGPLADNGGPTLTMALLAGSPAIDAGSAVGAPATDQRGIPRPQGPAVDIGAYECLSAPLLLGLTIQNTTNCCLEVAGLPMQTFVLQASSNLLNWWTVTNFPGTNGFIQYVDSVACRGGNRFYRLETAGQ
jgi:hypothetical protein